MLKYPATGFARIRVTDISERFTASGSPPQKNVSAEKWERLAKRTCSEQLLTGSQKPGLEAEQSKETKSAEEVNSVRIKKTHSYFRHLPLGSGNRSKNGELVEATIQSHFAL